MPGVGSTGLFIKDGASGTDFDLVTHVLSLLKISSEIEEIMKS